MTGLQLQDFKEISSYNEKTIEVSLRMSPSHTLSLLYQEMLELSKSYNKV